MELERIIRDTLTCFIQSHIPAADLSGMDDVFFSYITGVLEELGSPESSEETFDMDTFVEMMEAYIPGFAEIHRKAQSSSLSGTVPQEISLSDGAGAQEGSDLKDGVELLLEMFPACSVSQAEKALAMALGNLEEAVQLIVEEKVEIGPAGASMKELARPRRAPNHEELKQVILEKYMMVDSADDQKTHRPAPPKEAPKKLIRYIDNQVVSTKGERYKDIKKPESEEMKRTYISLKPARKYKFH
ncbi:cue domain-containing protein 2 [Limosa lapponica baueri]|uniref:Cue domain-containing protein 2 n=1 Tax=Limosa lapponica baueri TaxID=1758121 RepID=A0A2I0TEQ9_LIMLA|nr:cue domain-containing protein 2 [Limosa lapponica baueri]